MRFRLDRDVLADAVTWVARGLPHRPPSPVLAGLHLTASSDEGGSLALAAFDYEVSAKVSVAAEVAEPGEVLVHGRLLSDIARALPAKPVDIEVNGPKAVITCGSATFTLPSMPIEDYPALPAMPPVAGTIDASVFAEAVNQVATAATSDETLPLLTGVMIEIAGEHLTFLATDRYRLAIREVDWNPSSPDLTGHALVKARTLRDVSKTFAHTESVAMALSAEGASDIIGFEAGGRQTTTLLIDGDYPAIRKLLPTDSPISATVSVPALVEAVRRVSLVAERHTPLQIQFTQGQAVLNAGTGEEAKASEVIEATLEGEDITVAFNPTYLAEGLAVMNAPFVRLAMSHPTRPVLFEGRQQADGPVDSDYRYLLVPIRFAA
jgi:DNA polymerase-3 subunit beta